MRRCVTKPQFDRDVRRIKRRGKDIEKLITVEFLLEKEEPLAPGLRPHKLQGEYEGCWECHIESDWLLVWEYNNDNIVLVRTGSHSDLFE